MPPSLQPRLPPRLQPSQLHAQSGALPQHRSASRRPLASKVRRRRFRYATTPSASYATPVNPPPAAHPATELKDCLVRLPLQSCTDGGELIECTVCPRAYHLQCVGLEAVPVGTYSCPWHSCWECGRKSSNVGGTLFHCMSCPQAYCFDCAPDECASTIFQSNTVLARPSYRGRSYPSLAQFTGVLHTHRWSASYLLFPTHRFLHTASYSLFPTHRFLLTASYSPLPTHCFLRLLTASSSPPPTHRLLLHFADSLCFTHPRAILKSRPLSMNLNMPLTYSSTCTFHELTHCCSVDVLAEWVIQMICSRSAM